MNNDRHDEANRLCQVGRQLFASHRTPEALQTLTAAHKLHPLSADILESLGQVHYELGNIDQASNRCELAVRIKPDGASAWHNLGLVREKQHRPAEALAAYTKALTLNPNDVRSLVNRGRSHYNLANLEGAAADYGAAVNLEPEHIVAHNGLALALLAIEPTSEAWRAHEWRLKMPHHLTTHQDDVWGAPRWQGQSDAGPLLVVGEQGLGDNLFFARWLPRVQELNGDVRVLVAPALSRLFRSTFPDLTIYNDASEVSGQSTWISMGSLPHVAKQPQLTLASPSIQVSPELLETWQKRIGTQSRPIIGLVWKGTTFSIDEADLRKSLAQSPDVSWISLQFGQPPAIARIKSVGELTDLADSAALTCACDAVVTIDTAQAHISGGLMKPIHILMNGTQYDWRWHHTTPNGNAWYPTARLHRQNSWLESLASVRGHLTYTGT